MIPGLIDAHMHIESSLLTPVEYARLVARHGTTTVIADPHEIANVAGAKGIDYMLAGRAGAPVDLLFMLPSCVPVTSADIGGATLAAPDLAPFVGRDGVLGLGEMMNVPGVLAGDLGIWDKLALLPHPGRACTPTIRAGPERVRACGATERSRVHGPG